MERLNNARQQVDSLEVELLKKTKLGQDLMLSASVRQYEFERLRMNQGDLFIGNQELSAELVKAHERYKNLDVKHATLLQTNSDLESRNKDLQSQLITHPDAAIAASARLSARVEHLNSENSALAKRNAQLSADFNFTREQYQTASTAAFESAQEFEDLRNHTKVLQRKVDNNIAEYRRIGEEDINRALREDVEDLRRQVKQRDTYAIKLESEVAELRRGRAGMQTRGSSQQPRSPRGGGSRGVSPAPGFLGGQGMVRGGSGLGREGRLGDDGFLVGGREGALGAKGGLGGRFAG